MARNNYSYEKRQKELARLKKKEEKRQRKLAKKNPDLLNEDSDETQEEQSENKNQD